MRAFASRRGRLKDLAAAGRPRRRRPRPWPGACTAGDGWCASPSCLPRLTAGQASAPPSPTCTPGLPAAARCGVLTAMLADATNLGRTRMAGTPALFAFYRQLAWTAGWHLRRCPCAHPEAAEQWRNIRIEHSVGLIALIRRMI